MNLLLDHGPWGATGCRMKTRTRGRMEEPELMKLGLFYLQRLLYQLLEGGAYRHGAADDSHRKGVVNMASASS